MNNNCKRKKCMLKTVLRSTRLFGHSYRSAIPNAISREPDFSRKKTGKEPSRTFGNILFPVPNYSRHLGLASSLLVLGQETFGKSRASRTKINLQSSSRISRLVPFLYTAYIHVTKLVAIVNLSCLFHSYLKSF